MNMGPAGFYQSPISKGIIVLCAGCTLLSHVVNSKSFWALKLVEDGRFLRLIANQCIFSTGPQAVLGLVLLYFFRVFERMMGSAKYGSFIVSTTAISLLAQIGLAVVFQHHANGIPGGPLALIFALFVLFWNEIPITSAMPFLGVPMSDKVLHYFLGAQLALTNVPSSLIPFLAGIAAGLLWYSPALPISRFRLPRFIVNTCVKYLLPFVQSPAPILPRRGRTATPHHAMARPAGQQQIPRGQMPQRPMTPQETIALMAQQALQHAQMPQQMRPAAAPPAVAAPRDEDIAALTAMGFEHSQVISALRRSNNDVNLATNLLLDG
eukprot:TRINITY_DN15296_c0_g1_i1.p1 TRINITY_DN15296_c0_g1~~TRINITY_DN15296_c0_g1_i1.p1  ORF type:complete len:323 (+),score=50.24 TRINITY_DN15296_c0_g1_i1:70-1038(+)